MSNTISSECIQVNEKAQTNSTFSPNLNTIVRVIHNRENPFVQLNKQALWDPRLSLRAIGLWARCLSKPDNWVFNIPELIDKCLEGRDSIYKSINELKETGYVLMIDRRERRNGKYFGGTLEYLFFEFPLTLEEQEIFLKKHKLLRFNNNQNSKVEKHQLPENPDPGIKDPEKAHITNIDISSYEDIEKEIDYSSLKVPKEPIAPDGASPPDGSSKKRLKSLIQPSEEAKELAEEMTKELEKGSDQYRKPKSITPMAIEIEAMLTKDNRDIKTIFEVFIWALHDHFWKDKFYKPNPAKYLREKFAQLHAKMTAPTPKEKRKFAPSSNSSEALKTLQKMMETAL